MIVQILADGLESKVQQHPYKSKTEQKIARFLDDCDIQYRYEQGVLVLDGGKPKIWHPDFYLPEFAAYIEYYGLAGDKDYDKGIERKTRVYSSMGIDVIPIFPDMICDHWRQYLIGQLAAITQKRQNALLAKPIPKTLQCRDSGDCY